MNNNIDQLVIDKYTPTNTKTTTPYNNVNSNKHNPLIQTSLLLSIMSVFRSQCNTKPQKRKRKTKARVICVAEDSVDITKHCKWPPSTPAPAIERH